MALDSHLEIDQLGTQALQIRPEDPFHKNQVAHMFRRKVDSQLLRQLLRNNPLLIGQARLAYEMNQFPNKLAAEPVHDLPHLGVALSDMNAHQL